MKKLDLGCGKHKKKGCIGFDKLKLEGVDVIGDINEKLPFSSDEFDVIFMDNVLEHVKDITSVLKEVHRICKENGRIYITVPYYNSPTSMVDPTHLHYFHPKTLQYYCQDNFWNYYFDFHFKMIDIKLNPTIWGKFIPKKYLLKASQIFGNLIVSIFFIMSPVKN